MNSWQQFSSKKIISPDRLGEKVKEIRSQGKTIASLNGSFDLLHSGHLYIIYEASLCADVLIVALNSDTSIKKYKGPSRPFIPLQQRLEMMSALAFVDLVTWFEETDPRQILTVIKPDVHVNGMEYGEECIEAETVRKQGGKIKLVNRIPGLATSEIMEKIKSCV